LNFRYIVRYKFEHQLSLFVIDFFFFSGKAEKTSFAGIISALQTSYNCTVRVLADEGSNLKGVYIQDEARF
jgi:hypothetical protein